ncbi:DrmB family protein [Actinoplanes sp. GCM10030250]|uniref:DrmB family protein n=1 Tax=Actinoplanes sp. GCM10030250 TaxID=3273376 RepID=UPI003607B3A2
MTDTMIFQSAPLDPLSDAEQANDKNRAKVGSARPSALLYSYGPGAIMDLPQFSVMPAGLDDWDRIWARRAHIPTIIEPRLLRAVQVHLGPQVTELRPYPWQATSGQSKAGDDLGVPARVFPQWMRCTGCDLLAALPRFQYSNTNPFRPDLAEFGHTNCPGRGGGKPAGKTRNTRVAVPARYLLGCPDGHLDEFPYDRWVHQGVACSSGIAHPTLKLRDANVGQAVSATVYCEQCKSSRSMNEAQGATGARRMPQCRGRHPHLDAFDTGCDHRAKLITMGASNLWFAATQSVIVMPRTEADKRDAILDALRACREDLDDAADSPKWLRKLVLKQKVDVEGVTDAALLAAAQKVLDPSAETATDQGGSQDWDPISLLVPEWTYLQQPALFPKQENSTGLMVTTVHPAHLPEPVERVVEVNRMKKVNAFIGFTRIDEMERAGDLPHRLVPLTRNGRPRWIPATEDRGEGVFLQLREDLVAPWEERIEKSALWQAHRQAHRRNFQRRFSQTAQSVDPDERFRPPRYWLVHTLSHVLIREMAMSCGYGAASLSERIYAWKPDSDRPAAAGLLICTTASDSEGTLGGLVALARQMGDLVRSALRRAARCSSDPICAMRTPSDPEDFLHGAACHCCSFASETSCERANRFLDRRLLLTLPTIGGEQVTGLFDAE